MNGDQQLGFCLKDIQLQYGDTRDEKGRHRFISINPNDILPPNSKSINKREFFWKYNLFPVTDGLDCCSNEIISFHYLKPEELYTLEFLIYHITLNGQY